MIAFLAAMMLVVAGCPMTDVGTEGIPGQNVPAPLDQTSEPPEDDDLSSATAAVELTVTGDWVMDVESGDVFTFSSDGMLEYLAMPRVSLVRRSASVSSGPTSDCEILFAAEGIVSGHDARVLQLLCRGNNATGGITNLYMLIDGQIELDPYTNRVAYHETSTTRMLMEFATAGQSVTIEATSQIDVVFVGELADDGRRIHWISATGIKQVDGGSSYSGLQIPNSEVEITDDNWRLHYDLPDFRRPV
jgi:hypothetical protein